MIRKIKNKFKSKDNKRLLSNFLSLSVLQGANYILPLITLPYLVRVLGVEYFGLLAFATAMIAYFNMITDYGFNLTATREISIHREDKEKIVEIFSSVMTIKFILMILSFIMMSIFVFSFEKFSKDWLIYLLTFGTVIGQVLFPVWFFQGMEQMKYITYLNILAKSIFTIAIFIFIQEQSDFYIVPLLTSVGFIVAGTWSLLIIKKEFRISFEWQNVETLIYHLKEGWYVFISWFFTSFYTVSTTFILGIFTNNIIIGYYALAEKIVKAVGGLFGPINGAIFPYISNLIKKSEQKAKTFINKVIIYSSFLMGILSLSIFIFAEEIILLISINGFEKSILILKILSIYPLVITIAKILANNYIIGFNLKKIMPKLYFYTALLSLLLSFILIPLFQAVGAAISVISAEIFATLYMHFVICKNIGYKQYKLYEEK